MNQIIAIVTCILVIVTYFGSIYLSTLVADKYYEYKPNSDYLTCLLGFGSVFVISWALIWGAILSL